MNRHIGILSINLLFSSVLYSQGMKMNETLTICKASPKKELSNTEFRSKATAIIKTKAPNSYHLFEADRGTAKGQFLLVTNKPFSGVTISSSPFANFSEILSDTNSFTTYKLIGKSQFGSLPNAGILGLHAIKVKPEKADEFEKFVVEKLHPKVGHLFPDMQMMYYKAVTGNNKREYLLLFSIASPAARDKYWPEGKPETELLKARFKPLNELATALEPFLVNGSYLERKSGGAASIFESMVWTDYIHSDFLK